jgi:5-methylcytosine-specific restriction endonuclease McrA
MSKHSARSAIYQRKRHAWLMAGSHGWTCWLCHRHVDRYAPVRSADAPTIDHVVPMAQGGDPLDVSQWRLAHHSCNAGRGDAPPPLGATSRRW